MPSQFAQGLRTTRPSPRQTGQVVEIIRKPCECITCPRPPHCWQVSGCVPGAAPLPPQVAQAAWRRTLTSLVTPAAASASVIGDARLDVGAAPRPAPATGPAAAEDVAEDVGEGREDVADVAEPGAAEAVPGPAWPKRS